MPLSEAPCALLLRKSALHFRVLAAAIALLSLAGASAWSAADTNPSLNGAQPAQYEPVSSLRLTDEQAAWLREHPVIRVAAMESWPPFEFVDSHGAYKGISADLVRLLSERIGIQLELVVGDWPTLLAKLKAREADLSPAMGVTPEREQYMCFTKPVLDFPHAIYMREDEQEITRLEDLKGKTVAVEKDYYTEDFLKNEWPEINRLLVDGPLEALLRVSNGEADAYVGNTAVSSYLIDQNVIIGLRHISCSEIKSLRLSIGVRKDYAPLVDLLDQAMDDLTAREKRQVIERYTTIPQRVPLTEQEEAWIHAHPRIRLGVDPEFAPFEFVAEDGSYSGMASDYVHLLNQRLGLNMEVVHKTSWSEAVKMATLHELDVLPCVGITEDRRKHFLFSTAYLSFYRVIITREKGPLVTGLPDLDGLRVAVQAGSSHQGFLAEHSGTTPVLFDTVQETLAAVSRGKADAAVGNVATVTYWIQKLGLTNLQLAAPVDEDVSHLHFAVRRDWQVLVTILNKGLASVTEEEAQAIRRKWVGVSMEPRLNIERALRLVGAVVLVASVFLGLLALHNRRLRKEIHERQLAEEALRSSETNYRTLVESANSAILRMTPDGAIVFINSFAERLFGFTCEELIGQNVVGTIVPETETKGRDLRELMKDLTQRPEHYEANENENITKSGHRVWMAWTNRHLYDAQGNLEEILCVGSDVTARRRAEEVLFRYEFIVNTVDDMMSVLNAKGRYEAVNTAWCTAMGLDRKEVVGKLLSEVWPGETAEEQIWPNLHRCLAGEVVTYESVINLPTYGKRHCEVTIYPCADASGRTTHAVVVTHDVTDWRLAQAALSEAKQSAEAANRAKSTFLANMSHEIRTPMNAILGYTQLLQRQADLSPDQKHALDAIRRSGDHLLALINDVLEMSKIEAGRTELHPTTFDLHSLLADMEVMFRVRTNAKGLELVTEVDEAIPALIRADEGRVRQILINLLGNAVKFTDHGRVSVRVQLDHGAGKGKCALAIEVADTGCGIHPKDLESIFEHFEQASSAALQRGGTGLGLSISRSFARLMGGDITAVSEPGSGSRFLFTMLAEAGDKTEVKPKMPERRVKYVRPGQGEIRVLVVDDRTTNRDLLCRLLESVGFVTREAENGAEGLELFTDWQPQIVLIDLVMPVMSGREAIRRMRLLPNGHDAAIIAVTASTLDEARAEILAQGADAFLRKPFRDTELFELLNLHASVAFDYEAARQETPATEKPGSLAAAGRALEDFPADVRRRLRRAIVTGSIDDACRVAEEVGEEAPELAEVIQKHARDYALQDLEALLKDWGEM